MVRTFVALELSPEIKEQLKEAQAMLRGCSARLTFVDPALIHITVKFLGEVEEKKIPMVKEALEAIRVPPFTVSAGTVTVNNPRRPHTVWSVVDDGGNGERLLHAVDTALGPLGFAGEERRFTAHATLARVKDADTSLFPVLDRLRGRNYGSCMVQGMKLKKSTLTPRGPVYEDLLEVIW